MNIDSTWIFVTIFIAALFSIILAFKVLSEKLNEAKKRKELKYDNADIYFENKYYKENPNRAKQLQ